MTPASRAARDPRRLLPLPAHDLQILIALAERPRHGYALLDALEQQTGGRTRLGTSTLYAALTRLQRAEVIADAPPPPDADSTDERRRYYQITAFGRAVMREEALRIRQLDRLLTDTRILEAVPRSRGGA